MSNGLQILCETDDLVQLYIPDVSWARWENGFYKVTLPKYEIKDGINIKVPVKTLYSCKCQRPKAYSNSHNSVITEISNVQNYVFPFFEIAVNPSVSRSFINRCACIFSLGVNGQLNGFANMELAKVINRVIEEYCNQYKCSKVFISYRKMPQCLPCDNSESIGVVSFAELSIMGC